MTMSVTRSKLISAVSAVAMFSTGVLMAPSAALALDAGALPENGTVVGGSATLDYSQPNKLNVNQTSDRTVINWDSFNIGTDATTQFYQPNANSLAVNRVQAKGSDPTQILGKLIANGKVMVLDRNGVIFGKNSVVDVGGIIASTGDVSTAAVMAGENKIDLSNMGDGDIVNNGMITAADAGLVGFVGKSVSNNGVINAKLGRVSLASGEKATVDLNGDGLIEIAANSDLEKAIVSNSGTINAEGGTIQLTASAAKNAVDNVVNMDGVANVSSVTVKGGKIILGAGTGTAKVSGKIDASGTTGGDVKITGKNVVVSDKPVIKADGTAGKGGTAYIFGDKVAAFAGTLSAKGTGAEGGAAEISANESVGYYGLVDLSSDTGATGTLLIDPKTLNISSGVPLGVLADLVLGGTGTVNVNDTAIANTLRTANVNLWATQTANVTSNIDISTWTNLTTGPSTIINTPFGPITLPGLPVLTTGITQNNLTIAAPTVNISNDIVLGQGQFNIYSLAGGTAAGQGLGNVPTGGVNVDTINLNGTIFARSTVGDATTLATDAQLNSRANTINVLSNKGKINQAVSFADKAGSATTINVSSGAYAENVVVGKNNIVLKGAKAGVAATNASRGTGETTITGGVTVTGNNATVDGFTLTGGTNGVAVNNATGAQIRNNIITAMSQYGVKLVNAASSVISGNKVSGTGAAGIFVDPSAGTTVTANTVDNTGSHGIYVLDSDNSIVTSNFVGTLGGADNIKGDGIRVDNSDNTNISLNTVNNTKSLSVNEGSGINVINSNGMLVARNQTDATGWNGIRFNGSKGIVQLNNITNAGQHGIYSQWGTTVDIVDNAINGAGSEGIIVLNSTAGPGGGQITVSGNRVDNTASDGIRVQVADNALVLNNLVGTTFGNIGRDGIRLAGTSNATVNGNVVANTKRHGIYASQGAGIVTGNAITDNVVNTTGNAAVYLNGSDNTLVSGNAIGITGGLNNIQGDGIKVENSDNAQVLDNLVSNTKMMSPNVGSGIFVLDSIGAQVTGNTITAAGWNGIRFSSAKGLIQNNGVNGAGQQGIYSQFGTLLDIDANIVRNTGLEGIMVMNSTPGPGGGKVNVTGNTVYSTGSDGIRMQVVDGSVVSGNVIGQFGTIGRDGIRLAGTSNADVVNNTIFNTNRHGVYVSLGGANVTGNDVIGNTINNTGNAAIYVNGALNTTVSDNDIGQTGGANNIKGDGVLIQGSNGSTVTGNDIANTQTIGFDTGSGVHILNSNNILVDNNNIDTTGWDGIKLTGGNTITVSNNDVNNVFYNGLYARDSANVSMIDNIVTNATLFGVRMLNALGNTVVDGNIIDNVGSGGVVILGGRNVTISNNEIGLGGDGTFGDGNETTSGDDGIFVANSLFSSIVNNLIANAVKSGIHLDVATPNTAIVSGNDIRDSDIGMTFESGTFDLTGATNTITGGRVGYRFEPGSAVDSVNLTGNTIGTTVFEGQSEAYVQLANTALYNPGTPTIIDGTNASFDGFIPTLAANLMTQAQYDLMQSRIFDWNDDNTLGLFFIGDAIADAGIDQGDIFRDISGIPGAAGRFSITIQGLPRIPGAPANAAAGLNIAALNNITPAAGGSAAALNNITPAAGEEASSAQAVQEVEPAAGDTGANGSVSCWGDAVAAASAGQSVTYSFGSGGSDALAAASCSNPT